MRRAGAPMTAPRVLVPPLSKSDAQRALVLADIRGVPEATVLPPGEPAPRDVDVLRAGLSALRPPRDQRIRIECRDGGVPFRFLLTQAALTPGATVELVGTERLGERPHAALYEALTDALGPIGLTLEPGTPWPVILEAPRDPTQVERFVVGGEESSQYASSLLLGAARVALQGRHPCAVEVKGPLASAGYVALTRAWLEHTGFRVTEQGAALVVEAGPSPERWPAVPGDWSSLTCLLMMAWRRHAAVARVDMRAEHPDRAVVEHLARVGLRVSPLQGRLPPGLPVGEGGPLVQVTGTPTRWLEVDAATCPDAVPALAALACVLPGPSRFARTAVLRHKESDRVAGLLDLVSRAGAAADVVGDTLSITPGRPRGFHFDARDDHRLVMAAATLGCLAGVPFDIVSAHAVAKSFPAFWDEAAKLGLRPGPHW